MTGWRLPALRLLWWAVWAEFLLVRLFSRVGVYIPKQGAFLTVYRVATTAGETAFNFSLFLGVAVLALALWAHRPLVVALAGLAAGAALFTPGAAATAVWSLVVSVAMVAAVAGLGVGAIRAADGPWEKGALALVLTAHAVGYGVGAAQLAWVALAAPGQMPLAGALLRAGELPALLAPLLLAVPAFRELGGRGLGSGQGSGPADRPPAGRAGYFALGLAAVAGLAVAYLINADITAILAMYSLGFGLNWPAPFYLLALGAGAFGLAWAIRRQPEHGLALGLIFLAGYALHVNQQHILVLAGWALLALRPVPAAVVAKEAVVS
ncbi:MAG TPA: hypothetical protein VGK74_07300 [Symbiobacteriaceae bacterium]